MIKIRLYVEGYVDVNVSVENARAFAIETTGLLGDLDDDDDDAIRAQGLARELFTHSLSETCNENQFQSHILVNSMEVI